MGKQTLATALAVVGSMLPAATVALVFGFDTAWGVAFAKWSMALVIAGAWTTLCAFASMHLSRAAQIEAFLRTQSRDVPLTERDHTVDRDRYLN